MGHFHGRPAEAVHALSQHMDSCRSHAERPMCLAIRHVLMHTHFALSCCNKNMSVSA